ncbi:MAG TPA: hypothetical protein VEI50_09935 [Nitrospiraceae bacterium]|nr:hypothetical protein [Nitrospiraceae bacterium]
MRDFTKGIGVLLGLIVLMGCATAFPPNRLDSYLSPETKTASEDLTQIEQRPLKAGLVLVSDTSAPGAAPNLPDEAFVRLGEQLKQEVSRVLPVTVTEVLSAEGIRPQPSGDWTQFGEIGRAHKLDYLVVVVLSSTEQEYPMTLFLGWTTHAQPGYRRDNYSLLEFALLDLKHNRTLMRAEARGWATLDRPSAPGIDQWYPVIYLRPQDPERRIWPPTYEGAPNTLRVVSFNDAAKRLTFRLQNSWLGQLEADAAMRRASS